ncbi:MAG: 2-amino-4-hydroxy-6-hydroxymethyldihydropteridine diphosphokinase [Peptococcaceae bacterium]|jgi:2-amino-4-hydroxy-6-hydroxymethyldihydropteridine diphosphokinase|nr:2-amino-4-hydroxy-6-hydroxymethyldihydropteridine diphosphokinase [Peptococcaceae bacterium]MDH7523698.1 2-amino-4-hydroxy-6-hydroxymethyldihydropteridine diphosphokinase [Peptococcaceae bacterium]
MSTNIFYLSLGSNTGDSLDYLLRAVVELDKRGLRIKTVSGIYLTEPLGFVEQPHFLNMAVGGETGCSAERLLEICQEVETMLGRVREMRWGPRTIDIDILFYNDETISEPNLQVPHPRLSERAFVLVPLREIACEKFTRLEAAIPQQNVDLKIPAAGVKIKLAERGLIIE